MAHVGQPGSERPYSRRGLLKYLGLLLLYVGQEIYKRIYTGVPVCVCRESQRQGDRDQVGSTQLSQSR